jgi:hypothetical protein
MANPGFGLYELAVLTRANQGMHARVTPEGEPRFQT